MFRIFLNSSKQKKKKMQMQIPRAYRVIKKKPLPLNLISSVRVVEWEEPRNPIQGEARVLSEVRVLLPFCSLFPLSPPPFPPYYSYTQTTHHYIHPLFTPLFLCLHLSPFISPSFSSVGRDFFTSPNSLNIK